MQPPFLQVSTLPPLTQEALSSQAAGTSPALLEVLIKGGWAMVPLGLCSLLALAIVLERLIWGPSRKRSFPAALQRDISNLLTQGRFEELLGLCRAQQSPLARLTAVALENSHRPRAEITEALESAGKREVIRLQGRLGTLGTIASVSPLLGLLGTVFGIITSFGVIGSKGVGDPQALAAGIAEALIATAAGLVIAIPALATHRYFLETTRQLIVEMEAFALHVLDRVSEAMQTGAGGQAASASQAAASQDSPRNEGVKRLR